MTAPVVLHTLDPDTEGWAVRGALTELGGRLYFLAGECGPNGVSGCSSTAAWATDAHGKQCPGSLLSMALDGSDFRVEHAFSQLDDHGKNLDGYHPYGTLADGPDGRLYGVTQLGGSPPIWDGFIVQGVGVLFAYDPGARKLEVLHHFFSEPGAIDGQHPMGAVVVDPRGNVYGTSQGGGGPCPNGTAWEWSPGGAFRSAEMPGVCYGGLALAGELLHGTTWTGGDNGRGAYFTVDPETLEVRVVASFPGYVEPVHAGDNTAIQEPTAISGPWGPGSGGVIATREFGGMFSTGLLVRLDPGAGIRVLRSMDDLGPVDVAPRFANATGAMLNGRCAEGHDGLIYGVAQYGGANGTGCIWRATRDGSQWQVIYSWPDGAYPYGGVTVGSDGKLYGTTFNTGQVWSFDVAAVPL